MFSKLGLGLMMMGVLSAGNTSLVEIDQQDNHVQALELIEKAEQLSQTSDTNTFVIDGYEVSLGEENYATEDMTKSIISPLNTLVLSGNVSVSRPLIGGVMTATATSTTNFTAYLVGVRANVNNNGTSMSYGTWNRLGQTTFASSSKSGTSRTGIGHGNHEARRTQGSELLSFNTTNRNYQ